MTPEILTTISAVLLSLLASYCPGFSAWYAALDSVRKRLVMLGLLLAVVLAIFAVACSGAASLLGIESTCDGRGALRQAQAFLAALAANQAVYLISPKAAAGQGARPEAGVGE